MSKRQSTDPRPVVRPCSLIVLPSAPPCAQNATGPLPDPDPEVERQTFIVADGFEVNLFAADPLIAKPIQMNFDSRGPALGRQLRGLSADQAGPGGRRQGARPGGHRRRRRGRQDHRLRRRPADPHRRRARRRRRLRRQQHRTAPLQGHRRRRQGRRPARRALRLRHRGHPPHPAHPPVGARRHACTSTSRFISTATSRRPTACGGSTAAASGGSAPRRWSWSVFIRGLVNPWGHQFDRWGQSFATDGAGGEGINYCLPGAYYVTAVDADADPARAESRAARSTAGWKSSAAGTCPRLAGEPAHQRLPRQPRLPVRRQRRRLRLRLARAARTDQDRARRLPADRRQDGAGRRDLHRRLVQPDHPARRGRLPRPPPRPHPRPHLAGHRQGPPAGRAAQAGLGRRPAPARSARVARGLHPACTPSAS